MPDAPTSHRPGGAFIACHRRFWGAVGGLFLIASLAASCTFHRARHPAASATPPTAQEVPVADNSSAHPVARAETENFRAVGTVRVIGSGRRFVLIEAPAAGGTSFPEGQLLRCASSPAAVAPTTSTLRVSRERRHPFIVADVVTGEPHPGDAVFVVSTPPAQEPPLVLPTATSDVVPIVLPGTGPAARTP